MQDIAQNRSLNLTHLNKIKIKKAKVLDTKAIETWINDTLLEAEQNVKIDFT